MTKAERSRARRRAELFYDCTCRIKEGWRFVIDPDCNVHMWTYGAAWPLNGPVA